MILFVNLFSGLKKTNKPQDMYPGLPKYVHIPINGERSGPKPSAVPKSLHHYDYTKHVKY